MLWKPEMRDMVITFLVAKHPVKGCEAETPLLFVAWWRSRRFLAGLAGFTEVILFMFSAKIYHILLVLSLSKYEIIINEVSWYALNT